MSSPRNRTACLFALSAAQRGKWFDQPMPFDELPPFAVCGWRWGALRVERLPSRFEAPEGRPRKFWWVVTFDDGTSEGNWLGSIDSDSPEAEELNRLAPLSTVRS